MDTLNELKIDFIFELTLGTTTLEAFLARVADDNTVTDEEYTQFVDWAVIFSLRFIQRQVTGRWIPWEQDEPPYAV